MRPFFCLVLFGAACNWPATRMEPVADYGSAAKPSVSSAPAYTAGTNYRLTYSPDGSTTFVCAHGGVRPGWSVPPDSTPAC